MKIWFSLLLLICLAGCGKNTEEKTICLDGSTVNVRVAIGPSTTGSSWTIVSADSVNQQQFHVIDLPEEYKMQNTSVNACLQPTDQKLNCNCTNPPRLYRIISIRRR